METLDEQNREGNIEQDALRHMRAITGWMKLLAIFGIAIGSIYGIFALITLIQVPQAGLIGLIVTAIIILPCVWLLKSANGFSKFANASVPSGLTEAVQNLKNLFIFQGVFLILYILIIIVVIAMGGDILQLVGGIR